jgi:exodeoxyribonuclease-5
MSTDEEATVEKVQVLPHPIYGDRFLVYVLELTTDEGGTVTASVIHESSLADYNRELSRRAEEAKKRPGLWGTYWSFVDQFHDLRPCHALTVHRSQGSTFDNVFVDVGDVMSNRNFSEALRCLYVAVSRASTNVMLTGV